MVVRISNADGEKGYCKDWANDAVDDLNAKTLGEDMSPMKNDNRLTLPFNLKTSGNQEYFGAE